MRVCGDTQAHVGHAHAGHYCPEALERLKLFNIYHKSAPKVTNEASDLIIQSLGLGIRTLKSQPLPLGRGPTSLSPVFIWVGGRAQLR